MPPRPEDRSDAPLRDGSPEEFAELRQLLIRHGYTLAGVCERLGVGTISQYRSPANGRTAAVELTDASTLLLRLFMDGAAIDDDAARELLPVRDIETMVSLGVLHTAEGNRLRASVALYPCGPFYIVSDRLSFVASSSNAGVEAPSDPESSPDPVPWDVVYPAIDSGTQRFLALLPGTPCETFLDLCTGTGVAAIATSRTAAHVWAVDATDRATRFARFNAQLNGIQNVTVARGNLYGAVRGKTFDRIAGQPPFAPSLEPEHLDEGGDTDSEEITRRMIAGLPEHLRAGGRFYCHCLATDRKGRSVEDRVREALGERQAEFDVLVAQTFTVSPIDFYARSAAAGSGTFAELERRHKLSRELEVEQMVFCTIVVQRRRTAREVFTVRRHVGSQTASRDLDWLLRWEEAATDPELVQHLLRSKPIVAAQAELRVSHRLRDTHWVPWQCAVATEVPFPVEATCPPWVAAFLARCDGGPTVLEHVEYLKEVGALPREAAEEEFAQMVRQFIAGGFLEIDSFRLPSSGLAPASERAVEVARTSRAASSPRAD